MKHHQSHSPKVAHFKDVSDLQMQSHKSAMFGVNLQTSGCDLRILIVTLNFTKDSKEHEVLLL